MRLFTGLDLPPDVIANLDRLIDQLGPTARIKWSPAANLHITTRFIGEWPDTRLADLRAALGGLASRAAITVHVGKLGFYPNPHAPRIFWAGIEAPELAGVAAAINAAIAPLGLPPEERPFSPHLTLARIKDRVPVQALREAIAALPTPDFGSFTAASFFLYHSRPGPAGSVYTKLAEFPLSK
ncbi:MAG TPA: RNA 2',3'-cyclic phosphodiesterase [Bryobacteraceae bacterium]|nr:RNA 2',3'-cyclic phosphodiesterase [Bryobacteraceae bacterium]